MTRYYGFIACARDSRWPLKWDGGNLSEVSSPGYLRSTRFHFIVLHSPDLVFWRSRVKGKQGLVWQEMIRLEDHSSKTTDESHWHTKTQCTAKSPYFQRPYIGVSRFMMHDEKNLCEQVTANIAYFSIAMWSHGFTAKIMIRVRHAERSGKRGLLLTKLQASSSVKRKANNTLPLKEILLKNEGYVWAKRPEAGYGLNAETPCLSLLITSSPDGVDQMGLLNVRMWAETLVKHGSARSESMVRSEAKRELREELARQPVPSSGGTVWVCHLETDSVDMAYATTAIVTCHLTMTRIKKLWPHKASGYPARYSQECTQEMHSGRLSCQRV